jgi:hypothetical protein
MGAKVLQPFVFSRCLRVAKPDASDPLPNFILASKPVHCWGIKLGPKQRQGHFWGLYADLYVPNYFLSIFRVPLYVMFRQGYTLISQSSIDFKQRCSFGDRRNGNNPAPPLSMLLGPSLALISARLYKLGFRLSWLTFCFQHDGFVFLHYFHNLHVLRSNLGFLQLSI